MKIFSPLHLLLYAVILYAPSISAQNIETNVFPDPSFEKGPLQRKAYTPQLFISPAGTMIWDASGTKSHSGHTALGITEKDYLSAGVKVKPGTVYCLSGWFRTDSGAAAVRLQINWKRASTDSSATMIKHDSQTLNCTSEYKRHELVATSPDDATDAVIYYARAKGDAVWVDDVYFGEASGIYQ